MTEAKRAKRLRRYMRLLEGRHAFLRDTGDASTMLLEFPGDRTVRCARAELDLLARDGALTVSSDSGLRRVSLSAAGRAALRRTDTGDCAGQHRQLRRTSIAAGGHPETVTLNDAESPLALLARMRRPDGSAWLSRTEIAAGERLRADFERAMLQPRVTASWDFSHVTGRGRKAANRSAELADSAVAARRRVNAAMEAVGPELGGALVDLCCFLKGVEQLERERGWPRRSAKLMLKTALAMLDRHYHPEPTARRSAREILHWGADGYRPSLRAAGSG